MMILRNAIALFERLNNGLQENLSNDRWHGIAYLLPYPVLSKLVLEREAL